MTDDRPVTALGIRLRMSPSWDDRHWRVAVPVRVGTGVWLLALTAVLYSSRRGRWWGALLVPAAALHFYLACRSLRHRTQS